MLRASLINAFTSLLEDGSPSPSKPAVSALPSVKKPVVAYSGVALEQRAKRTAKPPRSRSE